MAVVANLTAILTANTSRYTENLRKAQSATTRMTAGVQKLGGQINRFGGLVAGGVLLLGLQRTVKYMDDVGKAADRMGVSTEALSGLAFAGKLAGIEMGELEKSIRQMQKVMVDSPQFIEELGLSVQSLQVKEVDDQLISIMESIMALENPAQRTAKAMEIFGARVGTKLINLMADGSKGIRELTEEARNMGLVFDREAARKAENLNDQITRLGGAIQGAMIQAADTGGLEAMTAAITTLLNGVIWLTTAYADLLRVFGVKINAADTIKAVQNETVIAIKQIEEALARADQAFIPSMSKEKIQAMKAELERLKGVLENTTQYLDENGNLVNPKAASVSKPNITLDAQTPAARVKTTTKAIEEQKVEVDKLDDSFDELGLTFTSAFEDAIVEGKKFSDVLRSMGQDILRLMTRRMVTEPLMSSLGGVLNTLGGSVTGALGGLFGGAFADGGNPPVGRMSLVGERGAELFVPRVNGTIIPNEMLGGSQNVYNIDARGTDASVIRRLEQTIQSLAGAGVVEARVADAQRRGSL